MKFIKAIDTSNIEYLIAPEHVVYATVDEKRNHIKLVFMGGSLSMNLAEDQFRAVRSALVG